MVTLYFVTGVGLDGLGLGFPCPGFSDGGLVKSGGGQEFYVIAYKK